MADTGVAVNALARLDRDIVEAERRLAELRAMRKSAEPFIEKYLTPAGSGPSAEEHSTTRSSLTDEVVNVFQNYPEEVFDVDDVTANLHENGVEATRDAVRNAIHYARRLGKVADVRRGQFTLGDSP